MQQRATSGANRRELLGASAGAAALPLTSSDHRPTQQPASSSSRQSGDLDLALLVNGQTRRLACDARTTLLDALRERLGLTGTKKGCDHGQCGACTVHLDGRPILACLTLAASCAGRQVTTIEGLAKPDGTLHPVQAAFLEADAFQCGYCTPGQIMNAAACLQERHAGSDAEVREYMSGNLCRCGAYPHIVAAIRQAAARSAA